MIDLPAALRNSIILRAGNRCEFCQLSQAGQEATFHIDHIVPRAAGGLTAIGRATVSALRMNRPLILAIRTEEAIRGRHPQG